MSESPQAVVVEADGGSRGNPGPSAYGALVKDAVTGELLAEDGTTIGRATNNVAEYRGLIGGLRLAADLAPGARVEVRMDSRLVIEQMAGRWKIKHPGLRPLAEEARSLAAPGTTWTWVPRAQNAHADRLANEALDGVRDGVTTPLAAQQPVPDGGSAVGKQAPARGWSGSTSEPSTTLVLLRHGVTAMTAEKRFSGGLGGSNPGLSDEGRTQVRAAGQWLAPLAGRVSAVIASPVRRTRESADILVAELQQALGDGSETELVEEPGFAEMEFGAWDGLTFAEVQARHGAELSTWLSSTDVVAGSTGESMRGVQERVLGALERVLAAHRGDTVVVVSHVTPIKVLVAHALGAPLESLYRMELAPASVCVVSWWPGETDGPDGPDGARGSLRLFNARPPDAEGPEGLARTW